MYIGDVRRVCQPLKRTPSKLSGTTFAMHIYWLDVCAPNRFVIICYIMIFFKKSPLVLVENKVYIPSRPLARKSVLKAYPLSRVLELHKLQSDYADK